MFMVEKSKRTNKYPFSAIVGQGFLKKALILNAVDNSIGGVLIFGERGTAKSTAVRAMADLLPDQDIVENCAYNCNPNEPENMCSSCREKIKSGTIKTTRKKMKVVELPVSSTEDKVVGSLDIQEAIQSGEKKFDPGVLAEANRNILYVDEVNLLNDHIVDVLLDAAAMGLNTVEREGISFSHPSNFILIGTMNPEEGDLRPQLLDRFGLATYIEGINTEKDRLLILQRLKERDSNLNKFLEKWKIFDEKISTKIVKAKEKLKDVSISDEMILLAINKVLEANVEGHRADSIIVKTAIANAAYEGRKFVEEKDIELAAFLALAHRSRDPPEPPPQENEDDSESDENQNENNDQQPNNESQNHQPEEKENNSDSNETETPNSNDQETTVFKSGEEYKIKSTAIPNQLRIDNIVRNSSGKRSETESENGRYVRYRVPQGKPSSISIDGTIKAAAINHSPGKKFEIKESDIREKVRERKVGNLVVFVVDASGSMGAEQRMVAVKGAIASMLTDAYQKRDKVSLIVFRGNNAEIVLPPTNSVVLAKEKMQTIPTGGKTPLVDGLTKAHIFITKELSKDSKIKPLLVLVSDGRGNVSLNGGKPMDELMNIAHKIGEEKYQSLVIDSETGFIKLKMAERLAREMNAKYLVLEDLKADSLMDAVLSLT